MGHFASATALPVGLKDKLPWEPLERLVRSRIDPDPETGWTAAAIGAEIGATAQMVKGYRERGTINAVHADTFAAALGLHPNLIWGHEVWEGQTVDLDAHAEERLQRRRANQRRRTRKAREARQKEAAA